MRTNPSKPVTALFLLASLLFSSVLPQSHGGGGKAANIKEGIGKTWKGPNTSVFSRLLTRKPATATAAGARTVRRAPPAPAAPPVNRSVPSTAAVKFRPVGDSGVAGILAAAFTTDPAEREMLLEVFRLFKQAYETEVAKEGKSNDLAAAMTLFVASNFVAYHQTEMPSDEVTEELYNSLRDAMAATPEIGKLSNAEKQQVHDWMIYMGGFVLAGYTEAKNKRDKESLANFKTIADLSLRLVLGIDAKNLNSSLRLASN